MDNFSSDFSKIYNSNGQNNFSIKLYKNFKNYCIENNIKIDKHLDMACGTGVFCIEMAKDNILTSGVDLSAGMLAEATKNSENLGLKIDYTQYDMTKYISKEKNDLITCNYDALNHLQELEQWDMFFKNVNNNLKSNGYFLFDFVTTLKFENMNTFNFSTRNPLYDLMSTGVLINDHQILFRFIYYVKNENGLYNKLCESIVESVYETDVVLNLLDKNNFRIVDVFDKNFAKIVDNDYNTPRLFVLAQKRD